MQQTFIEGRAKYGAAAWSSMIVKLLEDSVGTPLRAHGFMMRLGPDDVWTSSDEPTRDYGSKRAAASSIRPKYVANWQESIAK
jgi:hypothetical protein